MNCDQIIYLGIFAIIAVYLYQNVLTPNQVDYFTLGGFAPSESAHTANAAAINAAATNAARANAATANANAAARNANAAAAANANAAADDDVDSVLRMGSPDKWLSLTVVHTRLMIGGGASSE